MEVQLKYVIDGNNGYVVRFSSSLGLVVMTQDLNRSKKFLSEAKAHSWAKRYINQGYGFISYKVRSVTV